jgi:hypothetical protein
MQKISYFGNEINAIIRHPCRVIGFTPNDLLKDFIDVLS